MPYGFDQPDNAARVTRIGVGLYLSRRRYRADRAAARLDRLLGTSTYVGHARDAGRRVDAENGLAAACDTVEHAMATLCQSAAGV
jgi:UDP:flavonoid glycosyltransferase YjiC (YdhE family)